MNKNQAMQLAHDYINTMYNLGDDEILILEKGAHETSEAWLFRYDSKNYVETGNPLFMVQIEYPVLVNKQDGSCHLRMTRH